MIRPISLVILEFIFVLHQANTLDHHKQKHSMYSPLLHIGEVVEDEFRPKSDNSRRQYFSYMLTRTYPKEVVR